MYAPFPGGETLEKKTVSITEARQITIPQKFFKMLGFGKKAEVVVVGNELILRPADRPAGTDFADLILADLLKDGYSGEKLLAEFKKRQKRVRPAVENLIEEAHAIAEGKAPYATYQDIFGEEES